MPLVEVDKVIPAPVGTVWNLVNDVDAYPRLMEHVRSLELIDSGPDYRVTRWEVDLKGCIMSWVEREDIDQERYRIDYRQIEGDLGELDGHWQLDPVTDETTRAFLSVRFDIGMPALSEMLNPVAERAIRDNSRAMLEAFASHAGERVV